MKAFLLALLLAFPLAAASDITDSGYDRCMSGIYADDDYASEGIVVEVLDTQAVVFLFTYGIQAVDAPQTWFLFQGTSDGLVAYDVAWPDPQYGREVSEVGSGTLEVLDANTISFTYHYSLDLDRLTDPEDDITIPWCLRDTCEGERLYKRISQPIPCN